MPSSLIRQDVLPVAVGYLLVMGALATGLRLVRRDRGPAARRGAEPGLAPGRPRPAETRRPEMAGSAAAGWAGLARRYAGTAIGGYLLLMAVVILYYYGVDRVGGAFITSALTGCALLIVLTTPVFALGSWLAARRRARAGRQAAG